MQNNLVLTRPDSKPEAQQEWIWQAPFADPIKQALDQLYGNVFCSAARFEQSDFEQALSVYITENNHVVTQAILFVHQGRCLTVLNELFVMTAADLERFAQYVFRHRQDVDVIKFRSVSVRDLRLSFPHQCFNSTEDIVARLPETVDAYFSQLSRNTKESIRRYQKRLLRDHPEIEFNFYEGDAISPERIAEIIELSKARITQKGEVPSHTEKTVEQLNRLVSRYGVTLLATRHGKICGGVICTRIHGHFYMHVLAHDPSLDHLRLGKICCYRSICDAIERGAEEYHMLSGRYDYKYQFLGEQRDYDRITLYRSHSTLFFHAPEFFMTAARGRGRKLKQTFRNWRKTWNR